MREVIHLKHYPYHTEQSYLDWIKRYLCYHNGKHTRETGKAEIQSLLTYLAMEINVAVSTQDYAIA